MTLSDQDKQRILEEEKERLRVRAQLQAEEEKKKKRKIPKWVPIGCGGLVVLIIIIVVIAVASGSNSKTTTQSQIYTPSITTTSIKISYSLELLSDTNERSYGYITTSGEVKNLTNENLEQVEAKVSYYTSDGTFVKSDDALIDYDPILPGQTSPFKTIGTDNPQISGYKVVFKYLMGGTISTQDDTTH